LRLLSSPVLNSKKQKSGSAKSRFFVFMSKS